METVPSNREGENSRGGYSHLYGPVPSRRLGRSLGIDLVPRKVCSFDCIYCQVGKTTRKTLVRREYIPKEEILNEVRTFLSTGTPVDYLTLTGSGEPTLHSKIGWIIEEIKKISSIPVAVITNGSLLYRREVRTDLLRADVILPSLDAVSCEVFSRINRCHSRLSIQKILKGLAAFRKVYRGRIWLEILICKGINDGESELTKIREVLKLISPDKIHLNTVVRPPSEKWVLPVSKDEMERIRSFFGEKAEIITEFDRAPISKPQGCLKEDILKILARRPLSIIDLSKNLGVSKEELEKEIFPMLQSGEVESVRYGASIYYEISKRWTANNESQ